MVWLPRSRPSSRHSRRSTGRLPEVSPTQTPPQPDVGHRFRTAWVEGDEETAVAELLPVRLARACVVVLPVSGAGLSLLDDSFRVPLGASDETATTAERLQFTTGEGPCLDAARSGRMVVTRGEEISRRWPTFGEQFFDRTPYVAVISLPLPMAGAVSGALDLFLGSSDRLEAISVVDATVVSDNIVHALLVAQALSRTTALDSTDDPEPSWLHSPAAEQRRDVWVAMGMVMTKMNLTAEDALATLRGYAYAHDAVLDDVAADLMTGSIAIEEVAAA